MTLGPGDFVVFSPGRASRWWSSATGMVGMVLGGPRRRDDEYLSIRWADGETMEMHMGDLQPFDPRPCAPAGR